MKKRDISFPIKTTKNLIKCIIFLILVFPSSLLAASFQEKIVVKSLSGEALFRKNSQSEWQNLKNGQVLFPPYEVRTLKNTRLTLTLGNNSVVRVAPDSHLRINSQTNPELEQFNLQLILGKAWAKLRKNVKITTRLIIQTAYAQVDIEGTSYELTAAEDHSDVYVFSGQVYVSQSVDEPTKFVAPHEIAPPHEISLEEWHVIVAAFHKITITKDQKPLKSQAFNLESVQNDWIDWNLKQDQAF